MENFIMSLVLFGCCFLLNLNSSDPYVGIPSLLGVFASLGVMFYVLFKAVV